MPLWKDKLEVFHLEKKIALVQQDTARVFEGKAAEDFLETPRTKVTKIRRGSCSDRAKLRQNVVERYIYQNRKKEGKLKQSVLNLKQKCFDALQIPELSLAILRNFAAKEILEAFDSEKLREEINRKCPPHGCPPLHLAIYKRNIPVVQELLKVDGIDLELCDNSGNTALHVAVTFGDYEIVQIIASAGGDLSAQNRASQSVLQAAAILGQREQIEAVLEGFPLLDLARMYTRRFLNELFCGNPDYHHYRTKEYQDDLLLAFTVVWQPRRISRLQVKPSITTVELFEKEMFLEDFDEIELPKEPEEPQATSKIEEKKESTPELPRGGRTLQFEGYKLFRYVKEQKLKELISRSRKWNMETDQSLAKIASNAYQGSLTVEELKTKFDRGKAKYFAWKRSNKKQLKLDHENQLRAVADAIAAKRLREDMELKKEQERKKAEEEEKERVRKGLHRLSTDAGVKITHDGKEVEILEYSASTTDPAEYDVVLLSRPKGNVIIKCHVIPPKNDRPYLRTQPRVLSFTPLNWTKPQRVTISPINDDAVVKLKRGVATKRGSCNHIIRNRVQSTTDISYKSLDLRWLPHNEVIINVVD